MRLFLIALVVVSLFSCKEEYAKPEYFPITHETCIIPPRIDVLLRIDQLSNIFSVAPNDMRIVPNAFNDMKMRGFCFWDDSDFDGNTGIYLSIERNAYRQYGESYITDIIQSLKDKGETDAEGSRVFYNDFPEVGTEGAYSFDVDTYSWQLQNCILFKLVFNTSHSDKDQYRLATEISRLITDNYMSFIASLQAKS